MARLRPLLPLLALVLLGGGVVAYVAQRDGARERRDEGEPTIHAAGKGNDAAATDGGERGEGPSEGDGASRPTLEARPALAQAPPPAEADAGATAAAGAVDPSADATSAELTPEERRAVVPRNPFRLVVPPGRQVGGGGGPRPTGNWTRYPWRGLPRGTARLRVLVQDRDGLPVEGAEVYLGRPEAIGQEAVSFGDLQKIGVTGVAGVAMRDDLPVGSAAVLANVMGLTNGPRGLDARSGVAVVLRAAGRAEAEIRLPFALGERGTIRGVVLGPDGRPLRGAAVWRGSFDRTFTDAHGRFELGRAPAGVVAVQVQASGHAPQGESVEVPAGGVAEVTIRLRYLEEGPVTVRGTVVGPSGEPVVAATVYALGPVGGGQGTLRTVKTDEAGAFVMPGMPERLRTTAWRLQADGFPRYPAASLEMAAGALAEDVRITLPQPLVPLRAAVADATTGETLERGLVRAEPVLEGDDDGRRPGSAYFNPVTRSYETWLAPGRWRVTAEALDHAPATRDVELLPGVGTATPVEFRLPPEGPSSVDVRLSVEVLSATTRAAVERVTVEVLDAVRREAISRVSGEGVGPWVLPAPSGRRILSVRAEGYEPHEAEIEVPREEEHGVSVHLRPR